MKKTHLLILSLSAALLSCKKEGLNSETNQADSERTDIAIAGTSAIQSSTPLMVVTIAGAPHNSTSPEVYYRDGIGKDARFNFPVGIQLVNEKALYITEPLDNAVVGNLRKITLPNIVSTITLPRDKFGNSLDSPVGIGVGTDGTIHVSAMGENTPRNWIVRPDNTVTTMVTGFNQSGQVGMDTKGAFWFNRNFTLRKFEVSQNGVIGTDSIIIPRTGLSEPEASSPPDRLGWIYRFAYNGVLYVVPVLGGNNNHIYKYTPGGVFTRAFANLTFNGISCIISNKDSRTFYIADNGAIKSISDGKLKFLVGPNSKYNDGRDGVGSGADVHATSLALSKDENTIYFTDQKGTVRKLILNLK